MVEIGTTLREAREKKNISLLQVEEATKINRRYLEAIEANEFQELPGIVYAVGFLKNYARFLGLPGDEITELTETMKDNMGVAKPVIKAGNGKRRNNLPGRSFFEMPDRKILLGGLVLIIGLLILITVYGAFRDRLNLNSDTPTDVSNGIGTLDAGNNRDNGGSNLENSSNTPPVLPDANGVTSAPLNIKLVVQKDKCWIRIVADAKEVFNGILVAGDSREFIAEKSMLVHLGNAGNVEVFQNGQSLGYLGAWGQVVKREFY